MLRLFSNAGHVGSIPGQIANASWPKNQNMKQKQYCNKFNKDVKKVHIKKKERERDMEKTDWWLPIGGAGGQTKWVKVVKRYQNPVIK